MRSFSWQIFIFLFVFVSAAAYAQNKPTPASDPVAATVCQVVSNPAKFNNKMVRVRGTLDISPEYSVLTSPECSDGIWFWLGDTYSAPGLVMIVPGTAQAGGHSANGKRIPPIRVLLTRDMQYQLLLHYLRLNAKSETCVKHPPKEFPPDCRTYSITATFTGRIDGVSQQIHAKHSQDPERLHHDGKGFGQMGLFDAQLAAGQVEDMVAIDSSTGQPAVEEPEPATITERQ